MDPNVGWTDHDDDEIRDEIERRRRHGLELSAALCVVAVFWCLALTLILWEALK